MTGPCHGRERLYGTFPRPQGPATPRAASRRGTPPAAGCGPAPAHGGHARAATPTGSSRSPCAPPPRGRAAADGSAPSRFHTPRRRRRSRAGSGQGPLLPPAPGSPPAPPPSGGPNRIRGGEQEQQQRRGQCGGEAWQGRQEGRWAPRHLLEPEPPQCPPRRSQHPRGRRCHPEKGSRGKVVAALTRSNVHTAAQGTLRTAFHYGQLYAKLLLSKGTKRNKARGKEGSGVSALQPGDH